MYFKFKNFIFLFVFISALYFSFTPLMAQKTDTTQNAVKGFSFQYQIYKSLYISSMYGNFIALEYQSSNMISYRGGIQFDYSNLKGNSTKYYNDRIYDYPRNSLEYDIGFHFQLAYNINTSGNMYLYIGIGPLLGYSYEEYPSGTDSYRNEYGEVEFKYFRRKTTERYIGGSITIGGKIFIIRNISLLGESSFEPQYRTYNQKEIDSDSNLIESSTLNGWKLKAKVRVGFAFHF